MDAWTLHKKIALNCLGSGDAAAAEENLARGGEKEGLLLLQNTQPRDGVVKVVGGGSGSGVEESMQSSGGESQSEESLHSLEGVNVLSTPSRDAEVCVINKIVFISNFQQQKIGSKPFQKLKMFSVLLDLFRLV